MKRQGRSKHMTTHKAGTNKNSGDGMKKPWARVIFAALIAAVISILLILLYAWCLYNGWLDVTTVPVANTVLKALGAIIAALLAVRGVESNRAIIGGASGALYILLAFIMFSVLSSSFDFNTQLLLDIGMGALAGVLVGMLYGVLKKK